MNLFQRLKNEQHFPFETKSNFGRNHNQLTRIMIKSPFDIMWIYSKDDEFYYAYRGSNDYENLDECITALNAAEKYKENV